MARTGLTEPPVDVKHFETDRPFIIDICCFCQAQPQPPPAVQEKYLLVKGSFPIEKATKLGN